MRIRGGIHARQVFWKSSDWQNGEQHHGKRWQKSDPPSANPSRITGRKRNPNQNSNKVVKSIAVLAKITGITCTRYYLDNLLLKSNSDGLAVSHWSIEVVGSNASHGKN